MDILRSKLSLLTIPLIHERIGDLVGATSGDGETSLCPFLLNVRIHRIPPGLPLVVNESEVAIKVLNIRIWKLPVDSKCPLSITTLRYMSHKHENCGE